MLVPFTANGPLRHHWYALGRSDDVRDGPLGAAVLREAVVAWRAPSGRVVAVPDRCSHRPSDLSPGRVVDGCLVCPHHGRTFGDDGRCLSISKEVMPGDADHLSPFQSDERLGLVWVCLGDPDGAPPDLQADRAEDPVVAAPVDWNAPAPRIIETLLIDGPTTACGTVPFTYRCRVTTPAGAGADVLVTCTPLGAGSARIFSVLWPDDPTDADQLLAVHADALESRRAAVESVSGMFQIDEDASADPSPVREWRRALLAAVSPT